MWDRHSHYSHGHDGSSGCCTLGFSFLHGLGTSSSSPVLLVDKMLNGSGVKIFTGALAMSVDAEVVIVHDEQVPAIQSWRRSLLGGMDLFARGLLILNVF